MVDETTALNDLLAVIHRDGGQYIAEHGAEKAWADAMRLSSERIAALEALQQEVESIRSAAARVVTLARNGGAAAIDALDTAIENGASNGR